MTAARRATPEDLERGAIVTTLRRTLEIQKPGGDQRRLPNLPADIPQPQYTSRITCADSKRGSALIRPNRHRCSIGKPRRDTSCSGRCTAAQDERAQLDARVPLGVAGGTRTSTSVFRAPIGPALQTGRGSGSRGHFNGRGLQAGRRPVSAADVRLDGSRLSLRKHDRSNLAPLIFQRSITISVNDPGRTAPLPLLPAAPAGGGPNFADTMNTR